MILVYRDVYGYPRWIAKETAIEWGKQGLSGNWGAYI
jgi:hypothetical protein